MTLSLRVWALPATKIGSDCPKVLGDWSLWTDQGVDILDRGWVIYRGPSDARTPLGLPNWNADGVELLPYAIRPEKVVRTASPEEKTRAARVTRICRLIDRIDADSHRVACLVDDHPDKAPRTATLRSRLRVLYDICDREAINPVGEERVSAATIAITGVVPFRFMNAHGSYTGLFDTPLPLSWAEAIPAATKVPTTADRIVVIREMPGKGFQIALDLGEHEAIIPGHLGKREDAIRLGIEMVRRRRSATIKAIRDARGGDLSWGCPFPLVVTFDVVEPKPGQSASSAYTELMAGGVTVSPLASLLLDQAAGIP